MSRAEVNALTHSAVAWALKISTPRSLVTPASIWFAGRYCFGHDSPRYLEGLRIGCFATRREARKAASEWKGPEGETATVVRVRISIWEQAERERITQVWEQYGGDVPFLEAIEPGSLTPPASHEETR